MFESNGAAAACPGAFGVAKEDINCRCFLTYSFMLREEFIAQGGVIPDEVLQKKKELLLTSGRDSAIIYKKAGTGRIVFDKNGMWKHKELIDCSYEIGVNIDCDTGIETYTNKATIHYSKTGTHLVPRKEDTDA